MGEERNGRQKSVNVKPRQSEGCPVPPLIRWRSFPSSRGCPATYYPRLAKYLIFQRTHCRIIPRLVIDCQRQIHSPLSATIACSANPHFMVGFTTCQCKHSTHTSNASRINRSPIVTWPRRKVTRRIIDH